MPDRGARRTVSIRVWGASTVLVLCSTVLLLVGQATPVVVDYDIVYVRQPRYGETDGHAGPRSSTRPPSIRAPISCCCIRTAARKCWSPADGAVTDPFVSFDAQWCYYAYFPDLQPDRLNDQRELPLGRRGHLPHPSRDARASAAHAPGVHAQHRRGQLGSNGVCRRVRVQRYPRLRHPEPRARPGGRRQHRLHQQPQRLRAAQGLHQHRPCSSSSWTRTARTSRRSRR